MEEEPRPDYTKYYRIYGYGDVAWYISGHVPGSDTYLFRMVGDDQDFEFTLLDAEVIPDDAFCRECGQIGCHANVYS